MTNEQKLEALHEMFQSVGWDILKEQLNEQADAVSSISSVADEKQLYFNKGRLFEIKQYLALPEMVRNSLESPSEAEEDVF